MEVSNYPSDNENSEIKKRWQKEQLQGILEHKVNMKYIQQLDKTGKPIRRNWSTGQARSCIPYRESTSKDRNITECLGKREEPKPFDNTVQPKLDKKLKITPIKDNLSSPGDKIPAVKVKEPYNFEEGEDKIVNNYNPMISTREDSVDREEQFEIPDKEIAEMRLKDEEMSRESTNAVRLSHLFDLNKKNQDKCSILSVGEFDWKMLERDLRESPQYHNSFKSLRRIINRPYRKDILGFRKSIAYVSVPWTPINGFIRKVEAMIQNGLSSTPLDNNLSDFWTQTTNRPMNLYRFKRLRAGLFKVLRKRSKFYNKMFFVLYSMPEERILIKKKLRKKSRY